MGEFSRSVVGIVAVLVAASVVAGVGVGGAAATDHVGIEQSGATLAVTIDQSAFGIDDTENATVAVEIAGTEIASGEGAVSTSGGTNRYEIDLTADDSLADQDLSSANVTVLPEAGNESTVSGLDLRYVKLSDSGARYDGSKLVLPVSTAIGIPDGTTVELAGRAGGESGTLTATMRSSGTELVVSRTDAFATLALADRNLSVSSTGAVELDGGTYNIRENAGEEAGASLDGSSLVVNHPLLFEEREYTLTITTTQDGADVLTTRSGIAGDGSITVEHGGTAQAETEVTFEHGDVALGTVAVSLGTGPTADLSADGQNVTVNGRLGGEGETNVTVFAGESYEQRAQLSGVPYQNNTVLFGETGHELANASYLLLFEPDSGEPFASSVDAGGGDALVNSVGGGSSLGFLPSFDLGTAFGIPILAIIAVGVLFALIVIVAVWFLIRGNGDDNAGGGGTSIMEVNVRLLDGMTNELIDQPTRIEFEPTRERSSNGPVTRTIRGEDTVEVPQTTHRVSPALDAVQQTDSVSPANQQVKLSIPPKSEQITVQAAGTDIRLPDATVELAFPDGSTDERTTDDDGTAAFKVPYTVDERDCELTVDHDRYRSTTTGLTGSVALEPLTGGARVDARLDSERAPDVDVVVEPDDEYTQRVADPKTATTGAEGAVLVEDLPVGAYVAHLNFEDSDTVETTPASFEVTADQQVTETIDATFSFQLNDDQRRRIDDLHRDISELTPSNRDGAIPYYFGNVLSTVLSTVDEFEDAGVVFVSHGVDPDDATEATIMAVDDAVDYTRTAMTNKQNVDLFSACRGLREARVKWDGDVSVTNFVAFLGDEKANHRQEMISRLESVDGILNEKQDAVSTVTPARDQYDQVREHATGLQDLSPAEQRAHFFVGLQFLDAIESMFDQPELVDRLEETVF
ncbi:autotransporter outer membrane beta-barrel domain-containing protein [Halobacterium salinarum]|nr:hypothetical protein [Halobacterium salinarum]